jgi:hypothetical protein
MAIVLVLQVNNYISSINIRSPISPKSLRKLIELTINNHQSPANWKYCFFFFFKYLQNNIIEHNIKYTPK